MNPCKCGHWSPGTTCKRGRNCAEHYQTRISGPLLDRIDVQIEVPAVTAADLAQPAPREGSAEVSARVAAAREMQRARYAALGFAKVYTNAQVSGVVLEQVAVPDRAGRELIQQAAETLNLSARGYHRTLRLARTLADLDGETDVSRIHVAEALSYRTEMMQLNLAA